MIETLPFASVELGVGENLTVGGEFDWAPTARASASGVFGYMCESRSVLAVRSPK